VLAGGRIVHRQPVEIGARRGIFGIACIIGANGSDSGA
jgi:hypothetical protein